MSGSGRSLKINNNEIISWMNSELSENKSNSDHETTVDNLKMLAMNAAIGFSRHFDESPEDWHRKIQIQSLLFNIGIVLSSECSLIFLGQTKDDTLLYSLQDDITKLYLSMDKVCFFRTVPVNYAVLFFQRFLSSIKRQICEPDEKISSTAGNLSATSLAAWLSNEVGVHAPVAVGLSALILLLIGSAARDSFCSMDEQNFLQELD